MLAVISTKTGIEFVPAALTANAAFETAAKVAVDCHAAFGPVIKHESNSVSQLRNGRP